MNEQAQQVFRPYVSGTFTFSNPSTLPTYILKGVVTDIRDGERRLIRTAGSLQVDDGEWFATEREAKRKLALMLCDRIDAIRSQVDEITAEIRAAEQIVTLPSHKEGAAA